MKSAGWKIVVAVIALTTARMHAATCTSVSGGSWLTAGTWDTGVPTIADTVIIAGHSVTVATASATGYVATNLIIQAGSTLTVTNGGTIVVATNLWIDPTATIGVIVGKAGTNWTFSVTGRDAVLTSGVAICHLSMTQVGLTNRIRGTVAVTNLTIGSNTPTVLEDGIITVAGNRTDTSGNKGTTVIKMVGTGTWSGNASAGRGTYLTNVVDTAGIITFGAAATGPNFGGTNILLNGSVTGGTSTAYIQSASRFYGSWNFNNLTVSTACSTLWDNASMYIGGTYSSGGDNNVTHAGLTNWVCGNMTLGTGRHEFPCDLLITGLLTSTAGKTVVLTNDIDVTCGSFDLVSATLGGSFYKSPSTTFTVTNSMRIGGHPGSDVNMKSAVTNASFTFVYSGPYTNREVVQATFQDVNFVGNPATLFTYWGAVTRCTNIAVRINTVSYGVGN